ncbi:MAG: hypothetical protein A3G03_01850 [Candidatus Taylorbacteria bacterium RIFCSPLOWO2_12_FULL_44_15c]|uniref:Plasmid stabilization system n=1 Tax=Candidatus Taylorbacteria bacterium RIFCSPLOWO2_12_FULL_44_15c TaxID=1802333 RepID=A0A1G2PA32_9BACT|nr:MAG: hypothetical protein A3G03_01850 [Candidatus Taylorbacteria bacterium RIFCSPLOWO2_12_FULL_44_15c]
MLKIFYTPSFIKQVGKLETDLYDEVVEKVELLKKPINHGQLKVHKLKGVLAGRFSFSVNYKTRIVFAHISKNEILLHAIGDHSVYN